MLTLGHREERLGLVGGNAQLCEVLFGAAKLHACGIEQRHHVRGHRDRCGIAIPSRRALVAVTYDRGDWVGCMPRLDAAEVLDHVSGAA